MNDRFGLLVFLPWNNEWNRFHFNDDIRPKALDQIRDLGIRLIRMDILWDEVEPSRDRFDFCKYDRLLDELDARNLKVLAVLGYNRPEPGEDRNKVWSRPPTSFDAFAAYVHKTVDHFKNRIQYWEIWNEPNLPVYWSGPRDDLNAYARLFRVSHAAAKAADRSCLVSHGGLTEPVVDDVATLYRHGVGSLSDFINVHTFINPKRPDAEEAFEGILAGVADVLRKNGEPEKKIWITEMGCPGVPPGSGKGTWFAGESNGEEEQARWIERMYAIAKRNANVERLFWAFYRDTGDEFNDDTDYLGLVKFDLTPKPAYFALQRLIKNGEEERLTE